MPPEPNDALTIADHDHARVASGFMLEGRVDPECAACRDAVMRAACDLVVELLPNWELTIAVTQFREDMPNRGQTLSSVLGPQLAEVLRVMADSHAEGADAGEAIH